MNNFPVGTIVILQHCKNLPELNGEETSIIGALERRKTQQYPDGAMQYLVDIYRDNRAVACLPHQVRLKQLPPKESSSDEEAFRRFMDKTLMPLAVEQMGEV